jgi:uncharacterized protein (TIGR01244 family)
MNIKHISPTYAVTPQITVEDIPAIVAAGFGTIICNRPDSEVAPPQQAAAIQSAAEAAGLTFVVNPVTHAGLDMDMVTTQRAAMDASDKPVLAYCASGTRSTVVWGLGQAAEQSADAILTAASKAGYDLSGMRGQLNALAKH